MSPGALPQLVVNGLFTGSLYAMLALSWGLIFSTTSVFHFAHALTLVVGAYLMLAGVSAGLPLPLAMALAAVLSGFAGLAMEAWLYRPLRRRGALQLNVFLASLGLLIAGEAAVQFLAGPEARGVEGFEPAAFDFGLVAFTSLELTIAAVSWALVLGVVAFLRKSRYGLAVRAVESNPDLAEAFGLDRRKVFAVVFFVGSVMAGVAGGLVTLRDAATPTMGVAPVLAAFVAVFVGGIGSVWGAVAGGVLLGLLENVGGVALPGHLQSVVAFVLLFFVLVWRPSGLFAGARAG